MTATGGPTPWCFVYERDGVALRFADGAVISMVEERTRWAAPADAVDIAVLDRCRGSVLDVGCGPGRMVAAARARGRRALGIDTSPSAIRLARMAGVDDVILACVHDQLPREGRWGTVLLHDGNLGIGGDVGALLARCRRLVRRRGRVIAEVCAAEHRPIERARLESADEHTDWFGWAEPSRDEVLAAADEVRLCLVEAWSVDGRDFVELRR